MPKCTEKWRQCRGNKRISREFHYRQPHAREFTVKCFVVFLVPRSTWIANCALKMKLLNCLQISEYCVVTVARDTQLGSRFRSVKTSDQMWRVIWWLKWRIAKPDDLLRQKTFFVVFCVQMDCAHVWLTSSHYRFSVIWNCVFHSDWIHKTYVKIYGNRTSQMIHCFFFFCTFANIIWHTNLHTALAHHSLALFLPTWRKILTATLVVPMKIFR